MTNEVLEFARKALRQRVLAATDEEKDGFNKTDLAGRLSWALEWLNQRYLGFSRLAQAGRCNTAAQTISNIVVRRVKQPKYEVVSALAEDLGLTPHFLLYGTIDFENEASVKLVNALPLATRRRIAQDVELVRYLGESMALLISAYDAQVPIRKLAQCVEMAKNLAE